MFEHLPLCRPLTALAIAATIGVTGSASAQFGQAAGFGEMMSPYFMRRDLMLFADGLELDEGQSAIVETLYMDYEDEHEAGRERMFDRINDMRAELEEMDRNQLLEVVFQPFEDRSEEWDQMRERFLENVKAILNEEQLDQWPAFRRQLRRDKELPKGQFGAESVNLFHLVRDLDVPPSEREQLDGLLEEYDVALDRALRTREQHLRESRMAMMHAIRDEDPSTSVEIYDRQIEARVAIRNTNLQYARAMVDRLPEESGAELLHTVQMRAYPRIYRETPALRIIKQAKKLDDLSAETLDAIILIEQAYLAELGPINANLERLLAQYEPEQARYRANSFAMRASGKQQPKPVDPSRDEFKRRQEVGKRYVQQLQDLLTDEQFRSLSGASRYLRSDRSASDRGDAPKKIEERRYGTLNRAPGGKR